MTIKRDPRPVKTPKYLTKSANINIRVTPGEHKRIKAKADSMGLNITEWLEILIFGDLK